MLGTVFPALKQPCMEHHRSPHPGTFEPSASQAYAQSLPCGPSDSGPALRGFFHSTTNTTADLHHFAMSDFAQVPIFTIFFKKTGARTFATSRA
jgi:hypothetical protein